MSEIVSSSNCGRGGGATTSSRPPRPSAAGADEECVFCRIAASGPPSVDNLVVWRSELSFAVLNAYPYASGHLLVMPVRHVGELDALSAAESDGPVGRHPAGGVRLDGAYDPDGINMGANLGRAAGAGIPGTSTSTSCPGGRGTPTS